MSWNSFLLGDILKRRKSIEKIFPDKDYKLVTIKLYHKGVILRSIVKGAGIKSAMFSIKTGDFILSGIDARHGAFGIVPSELDGAVITNDFWCLEPDEKIIDKEFLFYLSSTDYFDHICKQSSDGTTQRVRLQREKFFNYRIDLPSIAEQKIILTKLKSQEKIKEELFTELNFQQGLLKKLKHSFLRETVEGKLVKQRAIDGSASTLLEKVNTEKQKLIAEKKTKNIFPLHKKSKQHPPYELPVNWAWVRFWDIAWCFRGHNPPKIYFKKEPQKGYVRFVQITDFKTDSQAVYVPITKHLKLVSKGEIIMAAYRHIGKLSRNMEGAFNVALCKINNIEPFDRDYLELVIKSDLITGELLAASERGHIPSMHSEHLLSLWVPVPPLPEQKRIVEKLKEVMNICDEIKATITYNQNYTERLFHVAVKNALRPEKAETGKIVAFIPRKCNAPEKAILAGRIIKLTNSEDFGRVKFQKLLYLTEHVCKLDLDSQYAKKVAGPYDGKLIKEIESTLKQYQFYDIRKEAANNYKVNYKPLSLAVELDSHFEESFASQAKSIDGLLSKFKKSTWEQCEIVATLYAVWNNRIIKQEPVADDFLKQDFLNWDEQKKKYKDRLDGALQWMRDKNVIPDGYGKIIEKPEN